MTKFIKGIIERKIPLSLTEELGQEEREEEITFNADDISSILNFGESKRAVYLKTPPFENTVDKLLKKSIQVLQRAC